MVRDTVQDTLIILHPQEVLANFIKFFCIPYVGCAQSLWVCVREKANQTELTNQEGVWLLQHGKQWQPFKGRACSGAVLYFHTSSCCVTDTPLPPRISKCFTKVSKIISILSRVPWERDHALSLVKRNNTLEHKPGPLLTSHCAINLKVSKDKVLFSSHLSDPLFSQGTSLISEAGTLPNPI